MKADELATLTITWQALPWEVRDLFARWLAGRLADLGIDKRRRIDVQAALLDLDGDAPEALTARRLRMTRRDSDKSLAELQAIMDSLGAGELAYIGGSAAAWPGKGAPS